MQSGDCGIRNRDGGVRNVEWEEENAESRPEGEDKEVRFGNYLGGIKNDCTVLIPHSAFCIPH